jgi:hypothetical protein
VKTSKLLLALTLVVMFFMVVLVWFFPPNGDFRVENPFWNGLSTLNTKMELTAVDAFGDLPSDSKGSALLLVPYGQFSDSELVELKGYVLGGGTLVLLDDYGYGNQVLGSVGVGMRFTGEPLLDPLFNYRNKWIPKITDFANSPIGANLSSIVFNHASCLNGTSGGTVAAFSSSFSFLDVNSDGTWDGNEVNGPFPVVAYERAGEGYVVAVADPSLMINGMIGLDDNLRFVSNVVGLQGASPKVFVDQAHLPPAPIDSAKAAIGVVYGAVASPVGTLSLIAVILVLSLSSIWRKGRKLEES